MAGTSSAPIMLMESEYQTPLVSQSECAAPSTSSLYFSAPGGEFDVVGRRDSVVERQERIERSKVHWSEVSESAVNREEEGAAEMENREVFRTLESHPDWGRFFRTFGYSLGTWPSKGELEVEEEPFAEGGQAQLFHARVTWANPKMNASDRKGREWVLKVFRKGTRLRMLQTQWPLGYFQAWMENRERSKLGKPSPIRHECDVMYGTLLKDGRFGFLMVKEEEDLRSVIDRMMKSNSGKEHHGPFGKDHEDAAFIMYQIALGLDWLHSYNIVHRDLKAANVLVMKGKVSGKWMTFVADYECSVGVVGTGFWRAPEILRACKEGNASKRPELFTKKADVYAYGMTCYEVLTGKIPFEGHSFGDHVDIVVKGKRPEVPKYVAGWARRLLTGKIPIEGRSFGDEVDAVVKGKRPEVPKYVAGWARRLLKWCWHGNPANRPSLKDICNILEANSAAVRDLKLYLEKDFQKSKIYMI